MKHGHLGYRNDSDKEWGSSKRSIIHYYTVSLTLYILLHYSIEGWWLKELRRVERIICQAT